MANSFSLARLGAQTNVVIEEAVQGFGAFGQLDEVAFQGFGERVEQAPHRAFPERVMARVTPLLQHVRQLPCGADTDVQGAYDQVMCGAVLQFGVFVAGDALVLVVPALHQPPHRALHQLRQIAQDEPGVLACEFNFATEAEVVTDKDTGPGGDAGGERLVVAVAQAEHPAVVRVGLAALDLHQAEVTQAVVAEAVRLGADGEAVTVDDALHLADQFNVRNGCPGGRGSWRGDVDDLVTFGGFGTAVEDQVGGMPPRWGRRQDFDFRV